MGCCYHLFCCCRTYCIGMIYVTSASRYVTTASSYQSRLSMYIRGLIPRNCPRQFRLVLYGLADGNLQFIELKHFLHKQATHCLQRMILVILPVTSGCHIDKETAKRKPQETHNYVDCLNICDRVRISII